MPYQKLCWLDRYWHIYDCGSGVVENMPLKLDRSQLSLPLVVYLSNFASAAVMSCASGFWIPVLLGLLVGVVWFYPFGGWHNPLGKHCSCRSHWNLSSC